MDNSNVDEAGSTTPDNGGKPKLIIASITLTSDMGSPPDKNDLLGRVVSGFIIDLHEENINPGLNSVAPSFDEKFKMTLTVSNKESLQFTYVVTPQLWAINKWLISSQHKWRYHLYAEFESNKGSDILNGANITDNQNGFSTYQIKSDSSIHITDLKRVGDTQTIGNFKVEKGNEIMANNLPSFKFMYDVKGSRESSAPSLIELMPEVTTKLKGKFKANQKTHSRLISTL